MPSLRVLIVEDNPDDADLLLRELRRAGFDPQWSRVETEPDFLAALQNPPEIILSDYSMPQFSGLRALELLRLSGTEVPFVLISGTVGEDVAVQAMRDGAADYLLKDRLARLGTAVKSALAATQLRAERKRAEVAQARLAAIVTFSDDAIIGKTLEGTITSWNAGAERVFGYTPAEAIGESMRRLFPPDRADEEADLLARVTRGESIRHFDTVRVRKDGISIDVSVTLSPLIDNAGQVVGVSTIARDITERKRTDDEALQRARLAALSAAIGLALADTDDLARALQRCAEALVADLGDACAHIWILDERERVLQLQAIAGHCVNRPAESIPVGHFAIGRIALNRKLHLANPIVSDPEMSDLEWARHEGMIAFAGHPLILDDRAVGVMALYARHALDGFLISGLTSVADRIARGIERHRSAEALRTAEERTRFALLSADVGIWDLDCATGVLEWSETLEAHYGVQPGTFAGTFDAFIQRVHPDDRTSLLDAVGKAMKSGNDFTVHNRSVWPDGTIRWLTGTGRFLLDAQGEPVRAVGISLDVTGHRGMEEQFHQAQKMEAVGRLAGGVAHDFNNLLTVILAYCGLLLMESKPDDPHRGDVLEIQKAGNQAAGLTRQLLAFSRKQIIEPTLVDLNAVAADLQSMLGRLIGEDVTVVLALQPGLSNIVADRGQVEQVVMNLAVNARDAMPKGGTLTIGTANIEVDEAYAKTDSRVKPGDFVVLTMTDTGTGMTREVQARLFEPFFTTKEIGKGTGLGLATVYGIVTRAGGNVVVDSEVGKGTSFAVYFPKADAAEVVADAAVPFARARTGTHTVLAVEDDAALRDLVKRLLPQAGYTVLVAADASEAMRLFEANPSIDVILTDVVMPGASGPELISQLAEKRANLRVIYMSGYTEDAIVHHGVATSGIAFLHKPFTSETLAGKIREVLER